MALLDFLKNKEAAEKAKQTTAKKAPRALVTEKPAKTTDTVVASEVKQSPKNAGKFSFTVIREPHISEKASTLAENNKYTFKVYANTNKPEIKKSVEGIYGVTVVDVNMIKAPKKKRRLGRTEGFRKAFVKAVVTIKEGQKIEIF